MKENKVLTIDKIRKKFEKIQNLIEKGNIIISSSKGIWLSKNAEKQLSEKNINLDEFLNWVQKENYNSTCSHYSGLNVCKVQIPEQIEEGSLLLFCNSPCFQNMDKSTLTQMEKKVLEHLAKGFTNKQIASRLLISPGTVNAYLDNIYRKLGVSNRVQAVCSALKSGIINI